jgi:hypothetical protein
MNQVAEIPAQPTAMQITLPELNEGEIHIGTFIKPDGSGHHTILLPGDYDDATWKEHMERAAAEGADLPNRAELVTMYEHFPEQFQKTWYWSNTTDRDGDQWAWYQDFYNGYQYGNGMTNELRARAVRRVLF